MFGHVKVLLYCYDDINIQKYNETRYFLLKERKVITTATYHHYTVLQ